MKGSVNSVEYHFLPGSFFFNIRINENIHSKDEIEVLGAFQTPKRVTSDTLNAVNRLQGSESPGADALRCRSLGAGAVSATAIPEGVTFHHVKVCLSLSFFFSPTLSQAGGGPAVGWLRVVRLGGGHGILQPAAASRLPLRVRKGPLLRHESATSLHIFAPTLHQRRPTQGLH